MWERCEEGVMKAVARRPTQASFSLAEFGLDGPTPPKVSRSDPKPSLLVPSLLRH